LRADLRDVLEDGAGESGFSPIERAMLKNILALRERRVADVMVPRADIIGVQRDIAQTEDALSLLLGQAPGDVARSGGAVQTLDAAPLTVFIASYSSPEGLFWAKLSAASTLAIAPIIILGWFTQRQLVRGLTFGAVK